MVLHMLDGLPADATYSQAPEYDEAYEIGKRDGYEDAVQELDIATGGDGEFKGSTFPGETVDVPVMKARIIERFSVPPGGSEAVGVKAGFVLAPAVSTEAMNQAAMRVYEAGERSGDGSNFDDIYAAMLAAAPTPPEGIASRDAVIEECAKVAEEESDRRLGYAKSADEGNWDWGPPEHASNIQRHKALTAQAIANSIRALRSPVSSKGAENG
jgi:hypothetical protein